METEGISSAPPNPTYAVGYFPISLALLGNSAEKFTVMRFMV